MKRILACVLFVASFTAPAAADDVTDTIESALQAYKDGDIPYAMEELQFAQQLMQQMQAEGLVAFLPEAPEGWTREVNTDMNAGLAMMGGGAGAEAVYYTDNYSFTLTFMADNPMVNAMSGMFGNSGMMASMGKLVRVGREKFVDQDGELTGMINNRVLVQASGAEADVMIPILEMIDFKELGQFGL